MATPRSPKNGATTAATAIQAIDRRGALLVFPLDNRADPPSIWSELHPRTAMRWEWDESGDDRVAKLWHLRTQLSTSNRVVYTKWFRGRATFFSREAFKALHRLLATEAGLSQDARAILDALDNDSPLSTKELKRATGLVGKPLEADYNRALKELWSRTLIVGYGEVDDGAFPSLAMGTTRALFEDLRNEARDLTREEAHETLRRAWGESSLWMKHYIKVGAGLSGASGATRAKLPIDRLEY